MADKPHQPSVDGKLVRRWVLAFVLFGLAWRLARFALAFPIWGDEAMLGLNVIDRSYTELLEPLKYVQVAPFGFLWLLRFTFDRFGVSDYTTRLPSLIGGIIALLLFWQWSKLLMSRHAAAIATGVVAVSGYIVRHGVEMKPYAMDFLAAVCLLLLATRYFVSRRLLWLGALLVAAPLCSVISYGQTFVAAGIGVALLVNAWRENWVHRTASALYCLVIAASFAAVMTISGRGQYHATAYGMLPYWHGGFPPPNPWQFILWFAQIHTGNLFAYPLGGKNGASLTTSILFALGLWAMWRQWSGPVRLMLFAPFLFTFIAAVLRLYPYGESPRISQHLAPAIILSTGAGIAMLVDLAPDARTWCLRFNIAGVVLLSIGVIRLAGNVIWPYKTKADQQMRETVRHLCAVSANDPIFVIQPAGEGPPTLFWYLREQSRPFVHSLTPPPESLQNVSSAWAITGGTSNAHLGVELAQKAQMKWISWARQDLQVGPKENGPTRLEVIHLVR